MTGAPWTAGGAALEAVGRVFFVMGPWLYSCSASVVVDSRDNESLVLTAGHCVIDKGRFATMWTFIPEYDPQAHGNGDQRKEAIMLGYSQGFLGCNIVI